MRTGKATALEIFGLILTDDTLDKSRASSLLRKLDDSQRQELRLAVQRLDTLIEEVWLGPMYRLPPKDISQNPT